MKIRFINAVCILALILASACKSDNTSQLKNKEMITAVPFRNHRA